MVKVGIIGCGYWGPNHIRVFSQLDGSEVLMCADLDDQRLESIRAAYPSITVTKDYKDVLKNKDIDAVCIVTPTDTHYTIAKEALECGKHVLCEKPLSLKPEECADLEQVAAKTKRVLMVGHVFIFNCGIVKLKEYIQGGELGQIYYAHSERTNLGPFRYDVNALWDLAPHDLSIFNFLFDACPVQVTARGGKYLGHALDDLAFVTLQYPNDVLANVHVSWLDPKKVRQLTIVGDKKMVVWDDLNNVGPIQLYEKYVERTTTYYQTYGEFQLLSREGPITIPKIEPREPLKVQDEYFIECILKSRPPELSDARKAGDVVKTLCAIQESMDQQGEPVVIK